MTLGDFFALLDQKGSPRGLQKHPARSPFWHPGAAPRPEASKTRATHQLKFLISINKNFNLRFDQ